MAKDLLSIRKTRSGKFYSVIEARNSKITDKTAENYDSVQAVEKAFISSTKSRMRILGIDPTGLDFKAMLKYAKENGGIVKEFSAQKKK